MAAGQVLTAGRSESNDIAIEHPTVSRRHIELRVNDDGSFDVIDLGASAGTFVFHNGKWTRFGHATVASDERLRLGSYETTAGALFDMAGEGAGSEPGPPAEDIHEVTTRRRGERRPIAAEEEPAEEDARGEERTTRGRSAGATKKIARASKKRTDTQKLPAGHAASHSKTGPSPRPARPQEKAPAPPAPAAPQISQPEIAAPDIAAPEITEQGTPKSLAAAYLLWFFLGGFGAHRFYLGSIGIGITHAALLVIGVVPIVVFGGALYDKVVPTVLVLLGVAVLTGLVVWWAVDGFLIPGLVRDRRGTPEARS